MRNINLSIRLCGDEIICLVETNWDDEYLQNPQCDQSTFDSLTEGGIIYTNSEGFIKLSKLGELIIEELNND